MNSHIIPKFQWKPLKKEEGYYILSSTDPTVHDQKGQKEIREYLLCEHCDTVVLQRNEDHLARVLSRVKKQANQDSKPIGEIDDFDYLRLKNGLLSILWRMSIARNDFFREVELGPKHSECLRKIILNSEETKEDEYAIILVTPMLNGVFHPDLIIVPTMERVWGNRAYRCLIAGFLFTFIVGSAPLSNGLRAISIRKTGKWITRRYEVHEIPYLNDILSRAFRS